MQVGNYDGMSYIRAVRRVAPTSESLTSLLINAKKLVHEDDRQDFDEPIVYAADSLRLILFERRFKAGEDISKLLRRYTPRPNEDVNGLIQKFHTRLTSPTVTSYSTRKTQWGAKKQVKRQVENPLPGALRDVQTMMLEVGDTLTVRANDIVESHKGYSEYPGTEYALEIEPGVGANILEAQRDMIYDAGRLSSSRRFLSIVAGLEYPLEIPFMRIPFIDGSHRGDIAELLETSLPVQDLHIGPIEWDMRLIQK